MAMTHEVYADHLGCTVSTFGKYGLPVTITTLFAKRDRTVMMMKEREKKNEDREINWGEKFFFWEWCLHFRFIYFSDGGCSRVLHHSTCLVCLLVPFHDSAKKPNNRFKTV